MTRIFNVKSNPVLTKLTDNTYLDKDFEILEYEESLHFFTPIILSKFLASNTEVLMSILQKMKVSINGIIKTLDNKIIEVKKHYSHSYNHAINNTPIIMSFSDFVNKVLIISKSITQKERTVLNKMIRDINLENKFFTSSANKFSFLEIMKLCDMTFDYYEQTTQMIYFPGGRVSKKDKTIYDTLARELKEEVNITPFVDNNTPIIYHNIFDKISEIFYHNLIVTGSIPLNTSKVIDNFNTNFEISKIIFTDIGNERYKQLDVIFQLNDRRRKESIHLSSNGRRDNSVSKVVTTTTKKSSVEKRDICNDKR